MARIWDYDKKRQRVNNPSTYYGTVLRNPKANERIKKKARDIIEDHDTSVGNLFSFQQRVMRNDVSYDEFINVLSENRTRRNTGYGKRIQVQHGLKTAYRYLLEFIQ